MTQRLILVTGMYGSGKTIYCSKFEYPVIHIDTVYLYDTKDMRYNLMEDWKNENNKCETLMVDAYVFAADLDLSKLRKVIFPILDIDMKVIYTTIDELQICQVSTPSRAAIVKGMGLSKEGHIQKIISTQKRFIDRFTGYLAEGIVSSVEYIFREGNIYTTTNKEHFLEILGGEC